MTDGFKISFIIITWNSDAKLPICLHYIEKQNFPKEGLEIIIVDGGSTDKTFSVIKKFQKKLEINLIKTEIKDPEPKRAIGALQAKGEYICSLDPDNYITDINWLNKMIAPLEKDRSLTGSQTLFYEYEKKESMINRYFALFGVNDPVVFYLKKADRIPHYEGTWVFNKDFIDNGDYFNVKFNKKIPTMGCNGVIFRKNHYLSVINKPENFFHIDVIVDLIKKGYTRYAIVKIGVLHSTGSTFWKSIFKRVDYMRTHYYLKQAKRRYLVFNPHLAEDKINIIKFILFTITIVQPLYLSFKGYMKKKDLAWFLHYPMCVGFLLAYSYTVVNKFIHLFNNGTNT